jgi:hypothetical protein
MLGLLKYYRPQVAKGKWDWDSVLLKKIPLYRDAKDREAPSAQSPERRCTSLQKDIV